LTNLSVTAAATVAYCIVCIAASIIPDVAELVIYDVIVIRVRAV